MVIGSFTTESSATKFAGYARSLRYITDYLLNERKSLYYVYVLKTQDRQVAADLVFKLRNETEFDDAWMYSGDDELPPTVVEPKPKVEKPVVVPIEKPIEKPIEVKEVPPVDEPVEEEVPVEVTPVEEKPKITFDGPTKPVARGKFFKFTLATAEGRVVPGIVYNVDRQAGRDLATYKANEYVDVLRPSIQGAPITIVCEVFGYNEVVKVIDYTNPANFEEAIQDENGAWVVTFTLERIKKGDVSVMYRLSFYKDAVIMTPASKVELDALVNLMQSNPTYKIKIHGHNNGNEKDLRIIMLGSDKNYFGMARSLSKVGNAKELSRLRAETIKSYLVDHGIKKNRIDTYAWGGTAMIAQQGTTAAVRLNNRIEIEVVDD